jgi:hypothetical protein
MSRAPAPAVSFPYPVPRSSVPLFGPLRATTWCYSDNISELRKKKRKKKYLEFLLVVVVAVWCYGGEGLNDGIKPSFGPFCTPSWMGFGVCGDGGSRTQKKHTWDSRRIPRLEPLHPSSPSPALSLAPWCWC